MPRNVLVFPGLCARIIWRLTATSRMPTVICVGRRSVTATGLSKGSRSVVILGFVLLFRLPVRTKSSDGGIDAVKYPLWTDQVDNAKPCQRRLGA